MLFNEIVEILTDIQTLASTEAKVYQEDEAKDATVPFIVVKNDSLGSHDMINNSGSIDIESFTLMCYDINRQKTKSLASTLKEKLRYTRSGTLNQLVFSNTQLTGGTVRLEDNLFFQDLTLHVVIGN